MIKLTGYVWVFSQVNLLYMGIWICVNKIVLTALFCIYFYKNY